MAGALFSPSWYRVKDLRPRLRRHLDVYRHEYRGRVWFILQDFATGRSHRFSPAAWRMIGLLDGQRTVDEVWEVTGAQLGEAAPTQEEAIRVLGQLHAADALISDATPDSRELFRRKKRHDGMQLKQKLWSPLAIKVPIWDPDRFLSATLPLARPLLSRTAGLVWLVIVAVATVLAVVHGSAIAGSIGDQIMTPQNLFVLWLVYPVVKAFHELGHAYAVKKFGGEVHEIGIMFLVLIPVPYVDASAASGFPDKYQRMLVGGIGIMVEMLLASLALFVWLNAEPGVVHVIAFNVMLIGGISTLLFNGNPLLRFDGYYVLADWIEIPNLSSRATKHLGYVVQRYLFGSRDAEPVTSLPGERRWFVCYGIAAFFYRLFIMAVIIAYIAGQFFVIGVVLAIWAFASQVLLPVGKAASFVATSPRLRSNRPRAVATSLALLAALAGLLFVVPVPSATIVEGVVWPGEQAQLRAGTSGFVASIATLDAAPVAAGDVIVTMDDPFLNNRLDLMDSELEGLAIQRRAVLRTDRVQAALIAAEEQVLQSDRERLAQQIADLAVRAHRAGAVVLPRSGDLDGRFVPKGTVIGYVVAEDDTRTVRTVVSQDDVDLVRNDTRSVSVLPVEWNAQPIPARILREVPGGSTRLPTPALGIAGGGKVPVDPADPNGVTTLGRYFEFEVLLDSTGAAALLGRRVQVRFDHGFEPIGFQAWRSLRQLFLRLYNV